jgi:hypothetical protein
MTDANKQLAKDVATELSRRARRRKLVLFAALVAAIALAASYVTCGKGWGLGGGGGTATSNGTGSARAAADAGPSRCTVRVTADGITVDGVKRSRDEAVAACKGKEGALVTVTGDARQGDWDELRAALEAVRVKIFLRGQQTD